MTTHTIPTLSCNNYSQQMKQTGLSLFKIVKGIYTTVENTKKK